MSWWQIDQLSSRWDNHRGENEKKKTHNKQTNKSQHKSQIHQPFMWANSNVFAVPIDSLSICFLCAFQITTNICLLLTGKQQVNAGKQIMFVLNSKLNIFFFLDAKTSKRVTEVKQQLSLYFWQLRLEERCEGGSWYWCKVGLVLNADTINKHTLTLRKFELCNFCLKTSSRQSVHLSHL